MLPLIRPIARPRPRTLKFCFGLMCLGCQDAPDQGAWLKMSVVRAYTVAFEGMEARAVEVQVHVASGLPSFAIVGLPDKAVAESKERVRAALAAIGLALPPKRITVNLAPADLPKEGSHYDLPIALALLGAMGA